MYYKIGEIWEKLAKSLIRILSEILSLCFQQRTALYSVKYDLDYQIVLPKAWTQKHLNTKLFQKLVNDRMIS